jgi:hypothetical protein
MKFSKTRMGLVFWKELSVDLRRILGLNTVVQKIEASRAEIETITEARFRYE